jgi:phi LC3 family holin
MHSGGFTMNINWKVRLKNPAFYLTMIPALLLVAQVVLAWFGVDVAVEFIEAEAAKFVNAVFVVLGLLGIVADPTTKGTGDSTQALTYDNPKGDK